MDRRDTHRLVILRVTNRKERITAALDKAGVPKEKAGKRLTLSARVECMASMLAALRPLPKPEYSFATKSFPVEHDPTFMQEAERLGAIGTVKGALRTEFSEDRNG